MLPVISSLAAFETIFFKLNFKRKKLAYEEARLEYRIFDALAKLEKVNLALHEEESNLASLAKAIEACGEGKIKEKLMVWKTKSEYKLFKINLRKIKIDVIKLACNQSKLEQAKAELKVVENDLTELKNQELKLKLPHKAVEIYKLPLSTMHHFPLLKDEREEAIKRSVEEFMRGYLKIAS